MQGGCFKITNVPVTYLRPSDDFNSNSVSEFQPDMAIFTSSYGVELYFDRFEGDFGDEVILVSIGKETARALKERGRQSIVPDIKTSTGVVELLSSKFSEKTKVAVFISSKSNGIIQSYLEKNHIKNLVSVLYHAEPLLEKTFAEKVFHKDCFGIIVTSSFEARSIFETILDQPSKSKLCNEKKVFSIGKTTSEELEKLGVPVSQPQGNSNLGELIREIEKEYC